MVVVVLQEATADGTGDESTTEKYEKRHQLNGVRMEKNDLKKTNPAEISDAFRLGYLFFIC